MLFNSWAFVAAFLPLALIGYFVLGRISHLLAILSLTAASLIFYAIGSPEYAPLLVASVVFNYAAGLVLVPLINGRLPIARLVLIGSIGIDLIALCYFKYSSFLGGMVGIGDGAFVLPPAGISFYTFTQIAFLVDIYKSRTAGLNPLRYTLFVAYFPHLIAGPILHHREMMTQFANPNTSKFNEQNFAIGLFVLSVGLFKKLLIADNLSPLTEAFDKAQVLGFFDAWTATLAFTFQIYFDFSAYCDMALGISLMFNIRIPINFFSPYRATSIIDFWRRWHITLSRFLRDYLYISLGGNRRGRRRQYINLLATMLLGGLWHGAAWTFVIWGGLHGLYLLVNHFWRDRMRIALPVLIAGPLTFLCVVIAWVFFRAPSLQRAMDVLGGMAFLNGAGRLPLGEDAAWIAAASLIAFVLPNLQQIISRYERYIVPPGYEHDTGSRVYFRVSPEWAICTAAALVVSLASLTKISPFIYFQF